MAIETTMEPFGYLGTLVEKVDLLSYEMIEKNEALDYAHTYLPNLEAALGKENRTFNPAQKKKKKLEKSLKESQEGQKKAKDDLFYMHLKNITLYKDLAKST